MYYLARYYLPRTGFGGTGIPDALGGQTADGAGCAIQHCGGPVEAATGAIRDLDHVGPHSLNLNPPKSDQAAPHRVTKEVDEE